MNLLQRIEHWGDTHHPKWIDLIRVVFGIFLCYKGIDFLSHMSLELDRLANAIPSPSFALLVIGHYVVFAHMLGGFLLAIGLATRLACLIQIPILLGAIIFVNSSDGLWTPYSELALSILVLLLLIYFLIVGNGRWSFDNMVKDK
ncbi:DoxX family protein [Pseudoflavitalea sp. X16]|uniref:DoxX family protein n=1 Tax=Paraflavitalea devenefica TaxID=2716334 RepID=UPI00142371D0|nr:DoxX family protein [Paraflavitalea devenefica]NII29449.1 DoxX family protein [Paraflavitalea devenefica]